jgi:hypothetical protein
VARKEGVTSQHELEPY